MLFTYLTAAASGRIAGNTCLPNSSMDLIIFSRGTVYVCMIIMHGGISVKGMGWTNGMGRGHSSPKPGTSVKVLGYRASV